MKGSTYITRQSGHVFRVKGRTARLRDLLNISEIEWSIDGCVSLDYTGIGHVTFADLLRCLVLVRLWFKQKEQNNGNKTYQFIMAMLKWYPSLILVLYALAFTSRIPSDAVLVERHRKNPERHRSQQFSKAPSLSKPTIRHQSDGANSLERHPTKSCSMIRHLLQTANFVEWMELRIYSGRTM